MFSISNQLSTDGHACWPDTICETRKTHLKTELQTFLNPFSPGTIRFLFQRLWMRWTEVHQGLDQMSQISLNKPKRNGTSDYLSMLQWAHGHVGSLFQGAAANSTLSHQREEQLLQEVIYVQVSAFGSFNLLVKRNKKFKLKVQFNINVVWRDFK